MVVGLVDVLHVCDRETRVKFSMVLAYLKTLKDDWHAMV